MTSNGHNLETTQSAMISNWHHIHTTQSAMISNWHHLDTTQSAMISNWKSGGHWICNESIWYQNEGQTVGNNVQLAPAVGYDVQNGTYSRNRVGINVKLESTEDHDSINNSVAWHIFIATSPATSLASTQLDLNISYWINTLYRCTTNIAKPLASDVDRKKKQDENNL